MQIYKIFFIYWICFTSNVISQHRAKLRVAAIFNRGDEEIEIVFRAAIANSNANTRDFELIPIIKHIQSDDPYALEQVVCDITKQGVVAIFEAPSKKSGIVAAICNSLKIPHIQYTYRKELRDFEKSYHTMTVNVHPNDLKLASAYAAIIESMDWSKYAIIYESERELIQLQDVLQLHDPSSRPVVVRQLSEGPDFRPFLKDINKMKIPYVIIHCKTENILTLMQQAEMLNMLGEYQSYFFAPLDTHTLDFGLLKDFNANITTIRIIDPLDFYVKNALYEWKQFQRHYREEFSAVPNLLKLDYMLLTDAVVLLSKALQSLERPETIVASELNCRESRYGWNYGTRIVEAMKNPHKLFEGTTSRINFNEDGQRNYFSVQLLEYSDYQFHKIANWNEIDGVVRIQSNHTEQVKRDQLISKKFFKVSSVIIEPFLFYNESKVGNSRFTGYSVDLINEIARIHNFSFEFMLAKDGRNGNYDKTTGQWNGVIKEVMDGNADMGICDLTMTSARREVVDFTQPFMGLGISLMYAKAEEPESHLFSFIDPFKGDVWLKMCMTIVSTVLSIFFSARMSPAEWISPHPCKTDNEITENIWNIKNSAWLSIGSLMGQGCDINPRSPSARVITATWWFFALMMLNSYTANLAAFLTTSSTVSTIKSVEDLAKQSEVKYGTVEGGSTQSFFRESNDSLYQKMWSVMKSEDPTVFLKSNNAGEERINKSKRKFAFFMESSVLEYKTQRNCDLLQVGTWLDYKTYGIAMPIGSKYRKEISESILKLGENGKLSEMKRKWWKEMNMDGKNCSTSMGEKMSGPLALAISNLGGVFLLLGMGIVVGLSIAFVEFFWNLQTVSMDEKITLKEAFKQEALFALQFWKTVKPINSSSHGDSMSKLSSKSLERSSLKINKSNKDHGSEQSMRSMKIHNVVLDNDKSDDEKSRKSSCFSTKSRLNTSNRQINSEKEINRKYDLTKL